MTRLQDKEKRNFETLKKRIESRKKDKIVKAEWQKRPEATFFRTLEMKNKSKQ